MPISDDLPFSPSPDGNASPSDLFQSIVFDVLMRLNVARPATVVAWSPPIPGKIGPTVSVLLDHMYVRSIDNATDLRPGETLSVETAGLRAVGQWVPLPAVPIMQWGSPQFNWRGAIPPGTTGVVLFADRAMDQWKTRGGPLDPGLANKHDFNDGIFLPTLYHGLNTPVVDPLVDVLGPDDGTAGFEITAADKAIRMFTTGPTANVDAAALVQLGNPLGPMLGVARLGDQTTPDVQMTAWIASVTSIATAAAAFLGMAPPVAPGDYGVISTASVKVVAEG